MPGSATKKEEPGRVWEVGKERFITKEGSGT